MKSAHWHPTSVYDQIGHVCEANGVGSMDLALPTPTGRCLMMATRAVGRNASEILAIEVRWPHELEE